MEDSATESSLLSELQSSSDLSSIHRRFSSYLDPFSAVLNKPKKHSKSSKIEAEASTVIRSLAKEFLPFLSKALSILPKRLNETPKIDSSYASELFETYRLCLSCLDSVSSQLSCKPHSVQIQRVRLIHCYENWGRYEDAQNEGFSVLEFIGKLSGKRSGKLRGRILPELGKDNGDKDVTMLILEVVVTLVKCVSHARSKNEENFRRVLSIVKEIQLMRIMDADAHEKLHRMLVTYLSKCALFLVGELASFDGKLAHEFCLVTFSEFTRSSMNDQMEKFGHRICSSLFSQLELDNQLPSSLDILTCVLDAMAHECKIGKEKSLVDFLELVDYCATAIKCRNATVDFCGAVATHFDKLADDFTQVRLSSIMRVYTITLSINDLNSHSRRGNSKMPKAGKDTSIPEVLLNIEDQLQRLTNTHGSYKLSAEELGSTYKALYFTALKFLCEPLSELINSERKDILCGLEDVSVSNIQDAFHQFRLVFLAYGCSERQRMVYEDNSRTVLAVASAAFTLSFTTKQNAEENTNFLTHIIKADWVHANGLKFLFASLHNVGIVLYKTNRLKEATESFKLCCEAAWNCVIRFCKMFASSSDGCSSDLSEDVIAGFVTEACAKSAFLLDILHQCGSKEISEILKHYLGSWSVAQSLFAKIPSPVALVKQWVKIECKLIEDPEEAGHGAPTIYSLMSSSEVSKETLGSLLEQELQAYKEMKSRNPKLCKTMQTTITNILLEEIYSTKDSCVQKCTILIAKGMESRACGVEGLNDCIKFLSEAISTLRELYNKSKDDRGPICHLLAKAYCLHALCTQEAEPKSKHFIQDIDNALKLWSNQDYSQSAEDMVFQNNLMLLYYVADLISLKGYMVDHSLLYETMIKFSLWTNVHLHDCLALLWQSRSLSHALCASPVNDEFIRTLSKHCTLSNSVEFWTSCMKRSKSLEVVFRQSLMVISTLSSSHSYIHDHATKADITIDEVKQSASDLTNSVPLSNTSLFLAAQLYYDLGERMIARGLMVEALSYAKQAHRLRSKLFHKKFMYSIEQQNDTVGANGEVIQKRRFGLETFHMHSSVATAAWSCVKGSSDFDESILNPWNILQCYLESTLQIGTLQEIVGNGSEAENLLRWGKDISFFQALPIFLVSFSAALGKLYRKQQLWHLAEKELESAKHILADTCSLICCSKCRLVLEVTVDQQFGDLYRSRFNISTGNKLHERLSKAEFFYSSAEEKLKLYEWRNCLSNPEEASARNTMFCDALLTVGNAVGNSSDCGDQAEQSSLSKISGKETIQPKVTRKNKKTTKPLPQEQRMTSRITRSSKQRSENAQNEVREDVCKFSERKQVYACTDALIGKGPQKVDYIAACGYEATRVCDEVKCWHCLPSEIMKSLSLRNIIQIKWECIRRRLLLRLLIGRGKCFGVRGEIQQAHKVLLKSISVLVSRSTFHESHFSISFTFLSELIEKNVIGDIFAVEQASILYNICWFSLKIFCDNDTRNHGCDSFIPAPVVVSGLKLAFILCREVPMLFQKVSRLLAVLYTLSPSNKAFSMLSSSNVLSESQWASYFHQASLGTHLNHRLFSSVGKQKDQKSTDVDGSCLSSSTSLSMLRLAPESVPDLEGFILKFFQGLPYMTIVCISMLGDDFAGLLRELLPYNHPSTHAWIMLSRFNSDSVPVVILLPVDYILAESSEEGEDSNSSLLFNNKTSVKSWHCPWGHTIIDEVAPLFKMILEDNYISSSTYPLEDTKKNRSLWWTQRRKLDERLSVFLRDIEDLWFGSWKHLLLGERLDNKHLDSLQKKLMKNLKSKCKVDAHESILKLVLGGARHASQQVECLSELIMNKGCYVGGIGCNNDESPGECSRKQDSIDSVALSVSELILNAIHEVEEGDFTDREPVILVPDFDIQMLPWENLPVLRNQEVYRMPTVASISFTYDRCCHYQEKFGMDSAVLPMIDPLDAYYLLNPGGDLNSTEAEFGNWFKDQNLQGTTGTSPTVDELSVALKSHDLFMYFGHGSGVQYIPGDEIQKLDRCAATLLMGCSSGSLSLNGCYIPKGAPLYYLHAGSPVIVANLWEVTDKDIDRFGKAMLDACIRTRSATSADCAQCCAEISEELEKMSIDDGDKRKGKKKTSKKKSVDDSKVCSCKHRPKIGSFMGQAREACMLPFLIGAAPVCYGVPTGIRKKDLVTT